MSDVSTAANTKVYVGGVTTTVTSAALVADTYVEIVQVSGVDRIGENVETVKYRTLSAAREKILPGILTGGEIKLTCNRDSTDAGQTALKAAFNAKANHNFKVTYPSGLDYYFSGLVTSWEDAPGDGSKVVETTYTIAQNSDLFEVA
jgi:hypothetical protein